MLTPSYALAFEDAEGGDRWVKIAIYRWTIPLDVTDQDSVKGFVHRATEELGDIELLVAGAGDTYFGRLYEISPEEFESQVQIHLIGAFRLANAVLPDMRARRSGLCRYHRIDARSSRTPRAARRQRASSPARRRARRAPPR